jgi:hypothetical protein
MAELGLCEINKTLWDILKDFEPFKKWNESKLGKSDICFISRDTKPSPDYDFIDLDALLRNVCIDIRQERREDKEFDRKFESQHKATNHL